MLVEFRVTNYRSIAEKQILSLVPNSDSSLRDKNLSLSTTPAIPKILRSAVIYGPNASGKSTLIQALAVMKGIVEASATLISEGQKLPAIAFRFDSQLQQQPSEFEVIFIENGVRYQYGFSFTESRVMSEWLFAWVKGKSQRWFERQYDSKSDDYKWRYSIHFPNHSGQRLLWEKSTRNNALFLSTAINLNSEQLRPIFNWFFEKLIVISNNAPFSHDLTIKYINKGHAEKKKVLRMLQAGNFAIRDINIENRKAHQFSIQMNQGKPPTPLYRDVEVPIIRFAYQNAQKQAAEFDYAEVSTGTQKWFNFAGLILEALEKGSILVVDELDSSLHTLLARRFIEIFHTSDQNKWGAQLICSTHNTSLLDKALFRRDQIWFIEKNNLEASEIYPLIDFSPRKDEAFEKGYLLGRYGALPFFGEINF